MTFQSRLVSWKTNAETIQKILQECIDLSGINDDSLGESAFESEERVISDSK